MVITAQRLHAMSSPARWRALFKRNWDKLNGLDFEAIVQPEEVGLDPTTAFRYSPSGNQFLSELLKSLGVSCSDRIIDIGCGKGSAMRTMLRFPFTKVAGVELAPALAEIAKQNFHRLHEERAQVYCVDATRFDDYSQFNFFYLYNPFPDFVLSKVLDQILSGCEEERLFIYNNPTCHHTMLTKGLNLLHTFPDQWGNGINVYTSAETHRSRMSTWRKP